MTTSPSGTIDSDRLQDRRIKFGTNLVTFYDPSYWNMPKATTHVKLMESIANNPRPYFDRIFDVAQACGLHGVELAPEAAGWTGAMAAYGSSQALSDNLRRRDLELSSSYAASWEHLSPVLQGDLSFEASANLLARHAEFVSACGAKAIVMGTMPREHGPGDTFKRTDMELAKQTADLLNRLGEVLRPFNMMFALHTDAYSICSRNEDINWMMDQTDPATVGLCPDVGHIILDGGDPVEVIAKHAPRVPVMHWKDCVGPLDGSKILLTGMERHDLQLKYFRVLGAGIADWPAWQEQLRNHQWSGWAQAEIDMSPDPVGEIREGLRYFEEVLAPIYR